jgi:hypothetical protein
MENDIVTSQEFLPKYETARIAVERARQIVKDNNDMISRIKSESNIEDDMEFDSFLDAENFSHNDSYAFDLYKIKSSNGMKDFIKNIFGVH